MNATSSTQITTDTTAPGTKLSNNAPVEGQSFSEMMSQLKEKTKKIQAASAESTTVEPPAGKVKAPSKGVDLSFLGEAAPTEGKEGGIKLADILAAISHETEAAKGTEVINFKNILAASNDDPKLLNSDLMMLLPKENRSKMMSELITGVKQEVKGRLARMVPSDRIPTTLKGMLETAIRIDVKVDDIKLETISGNKAAKELLTLFNANEKALASLPKIKSGVKDTNPSKVSPGAEKAKEPSPLQQLLDKQVGTDKTKESKNSVDTVKAEQAKETPASAVLASKLMTEDDKKSLIKKAPEPKIERPQTTKSDTLVTVEKQTVPTEGKAVVINESKDELDAERAMLSESKSELTPEVARRLNKKEKVRERVDLDLGKEVETKKMELVDEIKQTSLAQNDTKQKIQIDKRVDLSLVQPADEKDAKKIEAKQKLQEEKLLMAEAKGLKPEAQASNMNEMKTTTTAQMNTTLEKRAIVEEENLAVESDNSAHAPKSEQAQKAETALSAKIIEGKQLVSQLSQDIKEAMENYKPPFTKLTMKLRPEKLGEIDVMMVQRGNNVHINLSSNSAALSLLQQQSGDLKAALTDLGLGDTSMKFTQSDQGKQQQQQPHHSAKDRYEEIAKLESNIDMLELIVPRYG